MATPPRPPSRIDGKINPAYTAWRKKYILKPQAAAPAPGDNECKWREVETDFGTISVLSPPPEILHLRVLGPAKNRRFVLCAHEGRKVPVRIASRVRPDKLLKKTIPVRKDIIGYTHAP